MYTVEEIRQKKKQYGFTNATLSAISGVSLGTLNKILSGESKSPRRKNLLAITEAIRKEEGKFHYFEGGQIETIHDPFSYRVDDKTNVDKQNHPPAGNRGPGEYTIEDYMGLPDERRLELIDGYFYDLAAPSTIHQMILSHLLFEISSYIKEKNGPCKVLLSPMDVKLTDDNKTMLQPDLVIVCNKDIIRKSGIFGAPDFVLEVLSPSSEKRDMTIKLSKYSDAGVREYWVINPLKKMLIKYDLEESAWPQIYPLEGQVGISIYHNELQIQLDELRDIIDSLE